MSQSGSGAPIPETIDDDKRRVTELDELRRVTLAQFWMRVRLKLVVLRPRSASWCRSYLIAGTSQLKSC